LDTFYRRNGFDANKGRNKDFSITATHYYDGKSSLKESVDHPMIDVDGAQKHRNNSLGQPIHHTDDGIRNFHKWFGDSKVVDTHGRPQVYYHGTHKDIDEFNSNPAISNGIFFGPASEANNFATAQGANIVPTYLKVNKISSRIHNSVSEIHAADTAKKRGYDAIYVRDSMHDAPNIMVFHPSQIKSALGNDGTFDHPTKLTESIHDTPISKLPLSVNNIHDTRKEIIATDTYKLAGKDTGYPIQVGKLTLSKIGGDWRGTSLHVAESHRNKGLAFNLLRHAVKDVGPIKTSRMFSPGGLAQMHGLVRRGWADHHENGDFLIHFKSELKESVDHPMIDVDGIQKHRNNSLGQPIHHTDDGIRNFHGWFGDSKITDEHSRPKVMYHGTASDVSEFTKIGGGNQWGRGYYFHPSSKIASDYATGDTTGIHSRIAPEGNAAPNVMPVFISMKKPFVMDEPLEKSTIHAVENHIGESMKDYTWPGMKNRDLRQLLHQNFLPSVESANSTLRKIGYDGIIEKSSDIHMAFHPSQIKSAIGNDGTFDHPTKITEETMNYNPRDSAMAAYKHIISEASNDEELSAIWKKTANQPWHEYMKTVNGVSHDIKQQQGEDSVENDASKKRVSDYLTKYKHLF
jgi:hypothetical protein